MTGNEDSTVAFPFERRCEKALLELKDATGIDVNKAHFGDVSPLLSDPASVFESMAEDGLPLSQKVREYFFRHDEITACWRLEHEDSVMVGEFRLCHVMRAVTENYLSDIWESDNDQRDLYEELRVFDDTPRTGTGRLAALRATDGATDPEIWFFDLREGAMKMELDYAGYLEAVLTTKGVLGWQYLFCAPEDCGTGFASVANRLNEMLTTLPRLFPDYDYSELRARLEARL
ncbi:hypothetical protein QFZ82_007058 [Streptomyces sp. V4I23]|uniref:hypothetical protein n=1 Tax=Streptomyces sp. V4I23 TaxID=3042282 RepID=UPI002786563D|nr:hypothetical protein [Streptomyces sp. V4I23]MDQ1012573.1 hypothetical protein [Streptomyces sp. V4I23]